MSRTRTLNIADLKRDGGTQSRVSINRDAVREYADEMSNGTRFPRVVVYFDGKSYWLADGFHRVEAAIAIGIERITADVRKGVARDALLFAVGANGAHGLRRTNEDKRKAVTTLLLDKEWTRWSDKTISRKCAVSDRLVNMIRKSLSSNNSMMERLVERGGVTYAMDTTKIGKIPEDQSGGRIDINEGDGSSIQVAATATVQEALPIDFSGWNWVSVTKGAAAGDGDQAVLVTIPGAMPVSKRLRAFIEKAEKLNCSVFVTSGLRSVAGNGSKE